MDGGILASRNSAVERSVRRSSARERTVNLPGPCLERVNALGPAGWSGEGRGHAAAQAAVAPPRHGGSAAALRRSRREGSWDRRHSVRIDVGHGAQVVGRHGEALTRWQTGR